MQVLMRREIEASNCKAKVAEIMKPYFEQHLARAWRTSWLVNTNKIIYEERTRTMATMMFTMSPQSKPAVLMLTSTAAKRSTAAEMAAQISAA